MEVVIECLSYCSVVVESYHDQPKLYIRNHLIGEPAYNFQGLVHNHHVGEHTGMVLEQYLRALHPNPKAAGRPSTTLDLV